MLALLLTAGLLNAQTQPLEPLGPESNFGPYNVTFLEGSVGLSNPLSPDAPVLKAGAAWSMSGWLRTERPADASIIIAALGDTGPDGCRCLKLEHGRLALQLGIDASLHAAGELAPGSWHAIAATYDGHTARLYLDGSEMDKVDTATGGAAPLFRLAPESLADLTGEHHFGGSLASFQLQASALDAAAIGQLSTPSDPISAWSIFIRSESAGRGRKKPGVVCRYRNPRGRCRTAMHLLRARALAVAGADQRAAARRPRALVDRRLAHGAGSDSRCCAGNDIDPAISRRQLVHRGRARHGADDTDRERRLSRSRLRTQQSCHSRIAESPGLLVSQRFRRARAARRTTADPDLQRHQLCGRGVAQRHAPRRHPRGFHSRHLRRDVDAARGQPQRAGGARIAAAASRHPA